MEADLQQFYGIDYRDRWHPDPRQRLTLRRLCMLILRHPPLDGWVVRKIRDGRSFWHLANHQLDDLRLTMESLMTDPKKHRPKPDPDRPTGQAERRRKRNTPERQRKLADARARSRARRAARQAGADMP